MSLVDDVRARVERAERENRTGAFGEEIRRHWQEPAMEVGDLFALMHRRERKGLEEGERRGREQGEAIGKAHTRSARAALMQGVSVELVPRIRAGIEQLRDCVDHDGIRSRVTKAEVVETAARSLEEIMAGLTALAAAATIGEFDGER